MYSKDTSVSIPILNFECIVFRKALNYKKKTTIDIQDADVKTKAEQRNVLLRQLQADVQKAVQIIDRSIQAIKFYQIMFSIVAVVSIFFIFLFNTDSTAYPKNVFLYILALVSVWIGLIHKQQEKQKLTIIKTNMGNILAQSNSSYKN